MSGNRRIEELRRRVQKDPASIAFAELAEECRRAGQHDEAVRVCRAGLDRHPSHVPARVTLGRALVSLDRYDEARTEVDIVLLAAPDNFFALRTLAQIQKRRDEQARQTEPPTEAEAPVQLTAPSVSDAAALEELERWLNAILSDRAARSRASV